jgi:uncharacterized protein (TIGR03086 family)
VTPSECDLLESVLAETEATIRAVGPGQGELPTPCTEMDVAGLTDHLVGWGVSFASRLTDGADTGDPAAHRVGPRPATEFHEASQRIIGSYRGDTEQSQNLPAGFLIMEFLTHGWDLAAAIDYPVSFSHEAAELGLRTGRSMLKPEFRGAGKTFGEEVPVSDSADATSRLVAFLGRNPEWQATRAE